MNQKVVKQIVVGIAALVLMVLFSACAGVGTTTPGGVTTLSGSVVSVDLNNHSVTLNVNGQTRTINNVPNDVLTTLQSQVGKAYRFQLTQNSDGSYNIETGTTPELDEGTPTSNETASVTEPGSIDFIGRVQSVTSSSIVVSMPDGSTLPMSIVSGQTDLSKFNGALPGVGQVIKVSATANNGSFTATDLKPTDSGDLQDQNKATFQGVTTQAVGSDRMIHFSVGNRSFNFTIAPTADLKDFSGNAQSIANRTFVKVKVQFIGTSGTATDVSNNS
ncbi:MAG TPA: hypothetical protein VF844_09180 [Ktedonobacteraceae bacterium]